MAILQRTLLGRHRSHHGESERPYLVYAELNPFVSCSTARVVLPEAPHVDSDVEEDEEEEAVDGDENDILAGLPDDTEVSHPFFTLTSTRPNELGY
jgi:hypothetical protein